MRMYPMGPVNSRTAVVSAATNANPIVLTLATALGSGNNALGAATDCLTIGGATGNTNANGSYNPGQYTVQSPTQITLVNKIGNGVYGANSATASAPQRLVYAPGFPVLPGVTDVTGVLVARVLWAPQSTGTGFALIGGVGLSQANGTGMMRTINPPPTTGIMDYYDLILDGTNDIPIGEYWVDLTKPATEAVLTTFWTR